MSLQARTSEWDMRLYNPNRDVAHNFGDVMREAADRLESGRNAWPELLEFLKAAGATEEDLGRACEAFCVFVMSAADDAKERMHQCLTRSGWDGVPAAAQIALMAILGPIVAGYFWAGAREATLGGSGPCLTLTDLRERGRRCAEAMTVPRWRRRWRRLKAWALRVWDAVVQRPAPGFRIREAAQAGGGPPASAGGKRQGGGDVQEA